MKDTAIFPRELWVQFPCQSTNHNHLTITTYMESSSNKVKTLSSSKSFNIPERDLSSILKHSTKPPFFFVCLFFALVYYYPCIILVLSLYYGCIMIVLYYDCIVLSHCSLLFFVILDLITTSIHTWYLILSYLVCSIDLFRTWLLLLTLILIIIITNQYHQSISFISTWVARTHCLDLLIFHP